MKRRSFLKTGICAAVASTYSAFPAVWVPKKFAIRVLGTHVTLQEELRTQAMRDLGIDIQFEPGGSAQVLHKASTRPESFDLYEQWSNSINILWRAGAIQPIDKKRIEKWDEVNDLTKTGKLTPEARFGAGDAPYRLLHVQPDGALSENNTEEISFLPYVHNVDSIGYNSAEIPPGSEYDEESWAWLLDDRFRGKVAIVNAPTIGLFDLALAASAKGLMTFTDIANMTRNELDELFSILNDYKMKGHFRGVWTSVPQSVDFMARDGVLVESMFSPGVAALRGRGIPCLYAAPREGYRAWHGVMCLSSATTGARADAAYAYMNWWLSGWPGAFIARQGYYISTPHLSKSFLSEDEWNYWYAGKPTGTVLNNTHGEPAVQPGETRRGGSYLKRFSNVAVWNTVMQQYEYSLIKWKEFLLS
ncbi:ABC transporter substrate-binding protein [Acanthopleuribacter pedis]|uniref:Extracellular solute-binding protein n=1 Tax=Acanthopleuribacter pedis TaxID=442870 RepID=A0A8J7Q9D9_9BACT|nr:extracellular solute-binding protein [Acanthopleuribacter pedis]MBO1319369.1 extracellular solute-binding protein [Acanthopleuribacter pedis]